jgi:hypothetical protein
MGEGFGEWINIERSRRCVPEDCSLRPPSPESSAGKARDPLRRCFTSRSEAKIQTEASGEKALQRDQKLF